MQQGQRSNAGLPFFCLAHNNFFARAHAREHARVCARVWRGVYFTARAGNAPHGRAAGHFLVFSLNWSLFPQLVTFHPTQKTFARADAQGTRACVRRGWRGVYFTPRAGNAPHGRAAGHFLVFSLNWSLFPQLVTFHHLGLETFYQSAIFFSPISHCRA